MWSDSHCHLDAAEELTEKDISRAISAGISRFAIAGTIGCSTEALRLAEKYREIFLMAGIHPLFIDKTNTHTLGEIRRIAEENPKCIAIGEIGLDYFEKKFDPAKQKTVFREQLDLAAAVNLPVSIHLRRAFPDFLEIIGNYPELTVIMHMYSGSLEFAKQLQRLIPKIYFSFGGPATRENAHKAHKVLRGLDPEQLLVETDAPDLPPPGMPFPNVPANLPRIAAGIAARAGIEPEEFKTLTWNNAKEAFGW
ncbi:MAG: TatD family hydrolase [Acidobacteria bacterium]|nr:TatD family hydrolase [Acidobacteriota bacterium]